MSSDRYTAAQARIVENRRLVWLDGTLRAQAALDLDAYLASLVDDDTLDYRPDDRPEYVERHATLRRLVELRPAGDDHSHTFGLRKVVKGITRREGERRHGVWLVAPCACGHEFLVD